MVKQQGFRRDGIIKKLLNYHEFKVKPTCKYKKIISKPGGEGWLTAEVINGKERFLGNSQSEYLSNRLKNFVEKDDIKFLNKEGQKKLQNVYRLRRTKDVLKNLFSKYYQQGNIWEFITSNYFRGLFYIIPKYNQRYNYFMMALFDFPKDLQTNESSLNTYSTEHMEASKKLGTNIPPSLMYYLLNNKNTSNPLTEVYGDNSDVYSSLKIELSFWIFDLLNLQRQNPNFEKINPNFEKIKDYISMMIKVLTKIEITIASIESSKPMINNINKAKVGKDLIKEINQFDFIKTETWR